MSTQYLTIYIFILFLSDVIYGQEKVLVEGAIVLGNSESMSAEPGTIRWTGTDFEGWNGSSWVSLTKGPCGGLHFVKDVDASSYPTVAIGTQCWMSVNLRTENYNDGTPIPNVTAATDWGPLVTPAFCWYNDNANNANPYGALYNWYAVDPGANGNKNVCPIGWYVPTEQDITDLVTTYGGGDFAGNALKETGNVHFLSGNEDATNESGFTAIPGGYRTGISFSEKGYYAQYWLATSSNTDDAHFLDIEYDGDYANVSNQSKKRGNGVRCVKD